MRAIAIIGLIIVFLLLALIGGCVNHFGWSQRGNELTGQVKKLHHYTPLICPDYDTVDVSLGIMQNGTGSMSTHDMTLYVPDQTLYRQLDDFRKSGAPANITYDVARLRWCVDEEMVTAVGAPH